MMTALTTGDIDITVEVKREFHKFYFNTEIAFLRCRGKANTKLRKLIDDATETFNMIWKQIDADTSKLTPIELVIHNEEKFISPIRFSKDLEGNNKVYRFMAETGISLFSDHVIRGTEFEEEVGSISKEGSSVEEAESISKEGSSVEEAESISKEVGSISKEGSSEEEAESISKEGSSEDGDAPNVMHRMSCTECHAPN
jgi:hypothetical protein